MPRKKREKTLDEVSVWDLSIEELEGEPDRMDAEIAALSDEINHRKSRKAEAIKRAGLVRELQAAKDENEKLKEELKTAQGDGMPSRQKQLLAAYQTLANVMRDTEIPTRDGKQLFWNFMASYFPKEATAVADAETGRVRRPVTR